jgi:hypothetical protein
MASSAGYIACLWRVVQIALFVEHILLYDPKVVYLESLVIIYVWQLPNCNINGHCQVND